MQAANDEVEFVFTISVMCESSSNLTVRFPTCLQIEQQTRSLNELQTEHESEMLYITEECHNWQNENVSLRQQVEHLTGQLATRTVMYNALTRQRHEEQRLHSGQYSDKEKQNITLQAKLQQLSEQYEVCLREKTEVEISYREVVHSNSTLQRELEETNEARQQLEDDLNTATSNNRFLQSTVDSLKGTDDEGIHANFAEQVQEIQRGHQIATDDLRRQLMDLRKMTSAGAEEKELLIDEVRRLILEVEEKSDLLQQLEGGDRHQSLFQYSQSHIQHLDESISVLTGTAEEAPRSTYRDASTRYAPANGHNPLRESVDSTGSWSAADMLAQGLDNLDGGDDAGDSNVLLASREGLNGIAYQHSVEHSSEVVRGVLSVLETVTQSVAASQHGLSQVAANALAQLLDHHLLDIADSQLQQEVLRAVDKLVKRLVGAVHAHLGESHADADHDQGTHTHIHHTSEAQRRNHVSLESAENEDQVDGESSLPRRHRSTGSAEDEVYLRQCGESYIPVCLWTSSPIHSHLLLMSHNRSV